MKRRIVIGLLTMMMVCSGCGRAVSMNQQDTTESTDSTTGTIYRASGDKIVDDGIVNNSKGSSASSSKADAAGKLGDTTNYPEKQTETNEENSYRSADSARLGTYDDNDSQGSSSYGKVSPADSIGISSKTTDDNSSSDLSNYKDAYVEFISYPDQTISKDVSMILTNLSVNKNVIMKFTIMNGSKELCHSDNVSAGSTWKVNAKTLGLQESSKPYKLTVRSSAYAEDGTALNEVEQEINVTISDTSIAGNIDYTTADNQVNGSEYQTAVYYNADNTEFSAIVPAVISVQKDTIGSDIYVDFRTVNAKKNSSVSIQASNVSGNKANITLTGGSGKSVKASFSSEKDGTPSLSYKFTKTFSGLQQVGPIHCNIKRGKTAKQSYYGTCKFRISLKKISK